MTISIDQLVGFQRAEFTRASRLRMRMIVVQFAIGVPAIISVFVDQYTALFYLAVLGVLLLVVWFWLGELQRNSRTAAGRARRATLVMGGLGKQISANELRAIREGLTVSEEDASLAEDPSYFASSSPPGLKRLLEMLEESAFWTSRLQKSSALAMWVAFALTLTIAVAVIFVVLGLGQNAFQLQASRVVLALMTIVMSSDILGAARSHSCAANDIDRLLMRMEAIQARGQPEPDVLLVLSDYNAILEAAPLTVPCLYAAQRPRLQRLWDEYEASRSGPGLDGLNEL